MQGVIQTKNMTVGLRRAHGFHVKDVGTDGADMYIEGYAATYDRDSYGDRIVPGAFMKTITERGPQPGGTSQVKTLYGHCDLIGMPVELREDNIGLFSRSLIVDVPEGINAYKLAQKKVLDRMSFGFDVIQYDYDPAKGERMLKELKLYEVSFVPFPANERAYIQGVDLKSLAAVVSQHYDAIEWELREGRVLSTAVADQLEGWLSVLAETSGKISALLESAKPKPKKPAKPATSTGATYDPEPLEDEEEEEEDADKAAPGPSESKDETPAGTSHREFEELKAALDAMHLELMVSQLKAA